MESPWSVHAISDTARVAENGRRNHDCSGAIAHLSRQVRNATKDENASSQILVRPHFKVSAHNHLISFDTVRSGQDAIGHLICTAQPNRKNSPD